MLFQVKVLSLPFLVLLVNTLVDVFRSFTLLRMTQFTE